MAIKILNAPQNSEDWYKARLGIPTASRFSDIMAGGRGLTRATYMNELLSEWMSGRKASSFSNHHMERGHRLEPEAAAQYAFEREADLYEVGFVVDHELRVGCSPDRLVGAEGLLEIKCPLGKSVIEAIMAGTTGKKYLAQVQGQMWITGYDWCDLVLYSPGHPLFVERIERDEELIDQLADKVKQFNDELSDRRLALMTHGRPALIDIWRDIYDVDGFSAADAEADLFAAWSEDL